MVAPADSTYAAIETMVRRLTASPSESALPSTVIQQFTNTFYNQDFPNAIKSDLLRFSYTFYTQPYVDRYPLDINYAQSVRDPVYVDGVQGFLSKDRGQFYMAWPRWPTKVLAASGDGVTTQFSFTITGPFLSNQVTLGTVDIAGTAVMVADDGIGNLQLQVPNPQTSVPPQYNPPVTNAAVPGLKNLNTGNPGLINVNTQTLDPSLVAYNGIGTVDYVTGLFNINFPTAPASGEEINVFVSQYQTGKPYSVLFWNNEFTVRPIPKLTHRVEVETYMTPVQFFATTNNPIANQWWQYIAYGVSMEILRQRGDFTGVESLREGFMRQEGLVLERQANEEIGQRNATIFSSSSPSQGWNNGFFMGGY